MCSLTALLVSAEFTHSVLEKVNNTTTALWIFLWCTCIYFVFINIPSCYSHFYTFLIVSPACYWSRFFPVYPVCSGIPVGLMLFYPLLFSCLHFWISILITISVILSYVYYFTVTLQLLIFPICKFYRNTHCFCWPAWSWYQDVLDYMISFWTWKNLLAPPAPCKSDHSYAHHWPACILRFSKMEHFFLSRTDKVHYLLTFDSDCTKVEFHFHRLKTSKFSLVWCHRNI